ncbi:TRAP transporter substrate-binding protein [Roseospira goensis]|uniref:TRAP-type mannitol/chloroaromatic compound transport system substrate-binding protein n=1 Tax=Roseospira goensis TaxID=391922 RepID=A0A7W6WKJ8_9PROT|nr:TRAP transporter substrate-binding protein [Roseospira goensis]MBB4286396.1 TRAP-type mannitol/chloroaromatic compound transport system substrate-binding protein [Roseospira goensis]
MTPVKTAARWGGAAAVAAVLAATTLAGPAEAQDRVRWQMTMGFPSTLTALADTAPWVAEQVNTMSGGSMTLQVFEPGKLVKGTEVFDAVSQGKVDSGYVWAGYEIGKVPASALFGAQPFGLEPMEMMAFMLEHGGQQMMEEIYAEHNIMPLYCGVISPEAAGWFTFPLESLDQVSGMRIRFAGLGGEVMQKMDAEVTLLPGSELFEALEKGVIDATEFSLPTVDEQLGFFKVAKFYHLPGWHQPSTNQYLYINLDKWNGLSETQQSILRTACTAGVAKSIARAEALQGAVLNTFTEEHGVTAVQIPENILMELQDKTDEVMAEFSEKDEEFNEVWSAMKAFKEEHKSWKELGYLPRDWMSRADGE